MAQTPYPRSDRELLQRISRAPGEKAGYKQLIRELGLGGGRARRLLLEQLTRMVGRGELRLLETGMWALPRRSSDKNQEQERQRLGNPPLGTPAGRNGDTGRDRYRSGRLDVHRDGFGFVRPETPSRSGAPQDDIFIPPNELNGAMRGDLVLVDEAPPGRDGRRSGRIARVLTRRNPTVVGIFHYARSQRRNPGDHGGRFDPGGPIGNYILPVDERLAAYIEIPEGAERVPVVESSPHRTLGNEARQTTPMAGRTLLRSAAWQVHDTERAPSSRVEEGNSWPLEGLAVDVELTHFPAPGRPARGRILEVLGHPDDFGVDVEIIIRKHHLPHVFPPAVLAEARERAELTVEHLAKNEPEEFTRREDFRGLPIVTVDGETARDFDDAVLVRPLPNGNTELQVHIADVSDYVQPGSALDTEARVRGTSVYFPDRAVPMLPAALSNGMCSLRPEEDRLVLSCIMEIDGRGEVVGFRVAEGVIRSVRRCTYTSVQQCLNASPAAMTWNQQPVPLEDDNQRKHGSGERESAQAVTPAPTAEDLAERERVGLEQPEMPAAFDRMLDLALKLNAKRVRRGSIDFDLPEPVVEFDPDGNMKAIVRSERGWAHRLIEEFMLSANECVATWLTAQGTPSIYRVHELPDARRILEFEELAASFGQTLGVGAIPVKRLTMKSDRREVRRRSGERGHANPRPRQHDVPESIAVTPQMYQRLVRRIAGRPEEHILSYLMLRSLKQARYAEKNEGHFALASPCYTHFTSPIRRYPDLIVHRLVRAVLRGGADPRGAAVLSTDKQPWVSERPGFRAKSSGLSAQGSDGGLSAGTRGVEVSSPMRRPPSAQERRQEHANTERAARVGWSTDADSLSLAGSNHATRIVVANESAPPPASDPRARNLGHSHLEPLSAAELNDIAVESSQAERRAADAERELIEWKKMRFMAERIGDDFRAMILSVTKFGFFVELDELFVEGLVPLSSLQGDHYAFREPDRAICGARTGHCFTAGQRVEVILDRIDRQARRLQFALLPGTEPQANTGSISRGKSKKGKAGAKAKRSKRKST